jgi:hypothetical protein
MKKFIKSYLTALTILTAVIMNGCDVFENFQFGLPIKFYIEAQGSTNPSGFGTFCLSDDKQYLDYQEDINSITYVAAYIVTEEVSPSALSGDAVLRLYAGTSSAGVLLFEHVATNLTPADHDSTNAYKIELTSDQIADINASLAGGNTCFYGEYEVQNISGGGATNYIRVKIDVLFNVDAKLD